MARKGFYEELKIKEYLGELTPKMFKHANTVMDGEDDKAKTSLVEKLLPKLIDKGLPTMITGGEEGDNPISILFNVLRNNGAPQDSGTPEKD